MGSFTGGRPLCLGDRKMSCRDNALIFFCVLLISGMATIPSWGFSRKPPEPDYVPGQILVRFHETVDRRTSVEIVKSEGASIQAVLERTGLHLILLPEGLPVEEAVERFLKHPEVLSAEPNYRPELLEDR
jgi:hypothetical protein